MKIGRGNAIGKIILLGEHSVVYGEPALAIPFPSTNVETSIFKSNGLGVLNCIYYMGELVETPDILLGLTEVIKGITEKFKEDYKKLNIDIKSTIPPERGMGSSAAVAVATIRGLYDYFDEALSDDELLKWVNISERIIHGNPSGIDAMITSRGEPLLYIRNQPFKPFEISIGGYLIVGDTGVKGKTKEAVEAVAKFIEKTPEEGRSLIKELGLITRTGMEKIKEKNINDFGQLMFKAHQILIEIGVSDSNLNTLVDTAVENGALGAKLTGGGRGGCMIALADNKEEAYSISEALIRKGAKNTWISEI